MPNLTLAFFFADCGDPWWKTAVTEMLRSARRVMPDSKVVQLSPQGTAMHPWAHEMVEANLGPDAPGLPLILSKVKGYLMAQYAAGHPGETIIFTDADVIWTGKPPVLPGGAVAWDETAEALDWRQFYVQTGATEWPWGRYIKTLDALPMATLAADAAELALNYSFLPGDVSALSSADTMKFMIHFPGPANRDEMIAFARKLDGGEPFKEMDPGYTPPPKDDGKVSFPEIIFNTDTGPQPPKLTLPRVEGADAVC